MTEATKEPPETAEAESVYPDPYKPTKASFAESRAMTLFVKVKLRQALNHLQSIKRHYYVHIGTGMFAMTLLILALLWGFTFVFHWLLNPEQQPFGAPLMKRLLGMVLLAFFSMLTFSNLIIMLTTSYVSKEVEFLMAQPMGHRRLFFMKYAESTLYSSWAFLVLALPVFLAIGGTEEWRPYWQVATLIPNAHWTYYPVTAALLVPFIMIPAAFGALIALIVTAYFPTKKVFRLAFFLVLTGILIAVVSGRMMGAGLQLPGGRMGEIGKVMSFMGIGDISWMPSTWLSRAIRATLERDWKEVGFWGSMLASTALMSTQVCFWIAKPLYYRGFCASRSSGTSMRTRQGGLFKVFDGLLKPLPSSYRTLMVKDLTVFWRDPAQWGQLMVLFGLLFIYVANLGSASELSRFRIDVPIYKGMISIFNIGATCFILAILTTRFFYPMLSLEGKQQWVIGLAPLGRTRLVWVKYFLCWGASLVLTVPLILFSCYMLKSDAFTIIVSLCTIVAMSLGLNSLAIGLGALMPNFSEDNPARIANGLGGTINIMASMIYVGLNVVLETPIMLAHVRGEIPTEGTIGLLFILAFPLWGLLQALVIFIPMYLGLKNWRRLEF